MNPYKIVSVSIIVLLFVSLLGVGMIQRVEAQRITFDQLYNMAIDQLYDMFRVLYMSWKNYRLIEDYEIEYLVAWCEDMLKKQEAPLSGFEVGYPKAFYIGGYKGVNLAVIIMLVSCVKAVLSNQGLLAQLRYLIRIDGISRDTLSMYVTKIVRAFPDIETKLYDAVKSIIDSIKNTDTKSELEWGWAKYGLVESLRRAIAKVLEHLASAVRYWTDKLLSGSMSISIPVVIFICIPKFLYPLRFPLPGWVDRGDAYCFVGNKPVAV